MSATEARRNTAVDDFYNRFIAWAMAEKDVRAVIQLGDFDRKKGTGWSDVDLLIATTQPQRRLAETDHGFEAPVARADRVKRPSDSGQRRGGISAPPFAAPLAHADHVRKEIIERRVPADPDDDPLTVAVKTNVLVQLDHLRTYPAIAEAEARLGKTGRLLIRKSGTEPLIRVMGESEDERLLGTIISEICAVIQQAGH